MKQTSHLAEEKSHMTDQSFLPVSQLIFLIQRLWVRFHLVKVPLILLIFKQCHDRMEAVGDENSQLMGSSQKQIKIKIINK